MQIFLSILCNGIILWAMSYFLPLNSVTNTGVLANGGLQLFFIGGIILWVLNFVVRPLLKLIGLPFIFLTFGLFILVINGIILWLLENIIKLLSITNVAFEIRGVVNFIIAVAIFTVFNTIYNTFLKKG
jgi:putative membrane protein